jgi:hypothetical protein
MSRGSDPSTRCGQPEASLTSGGSGRDAALTRLGIKDMSTIDAFDHVAVWIIECLQKITARAEDRPS